MKRMALAPHPFQVFALARLRVKMMERTLRALRLRQADRRHRNRDLWGEEVLYVDRMVLPGSSELAGDGIEWAAGAGLDALILHENLARECSSVDHGLLAVPSRDAKGSGERAELAGGWTLLAPRNPRSRPAPPGRAFGVLLGQAPTGYWGMDRARADALKAPFRELQRWRNGGRRPVALGFSNANSPYAIGSLCTALVGPAANANNPKSVVQGLASGAATWSNGPLLDFDCNGVGMGGALRKKHARLEVSFRVADERGIGKVRCFVGEKAAREFPGRGLRVLDVVFLLDVPRKAPFVRLDAVTTDGCWVFTNPVWLA
ncbi:MAG: hypothetical protein KIS92_08235 [Planctomycetota bacterium]|nr:hypothetical protein [Planctomycetota bacterium]